MTNPYKLARRAADELREESGYDNYDIAIVLGSGWREGAVALGTPDNVHLDVVAEWIRRARRSPVTAARSCP